MNTPIMILLEMVLLFKQFLCAKISVTEILVILIFCEEMNPRVSSLLVIMRNGLLKKQTNGAQMLQI